MNPSRSRARAGRWFVAPNLAAVAVFMAAAATTVYLVRHAGVL